MKATNIQWDVDDPDDLKDLPTEMDIPDGINPDDYDSIDEYLSDITGFCHKGYDIQE